ncbi:MAG: hypothetical protein IIX13_09340 [Bacteroidales bacterium]|nr:hypothetical protein [Bacteroidales bacterium]
MELTRELIIREARRWVGYGESDWADYLAYDDPKGGNGRSNYNRFSWLFDRLLAPKTYAGGNKDGFAWCATFVTMTIGTATITEKENLVHKVSAARLAQIHEWQKEVLENLHAALYLKGESLRAASLLAGVGSFPKFTAIHPCTLSELQPADLVIFGNAACATAHIGLVESAGGGQFVTIEGNTKMGAATPNGGQVCRKTYAPNGAGLVEIRLGQKLKSWDKVNFYKIKVK